MTEVVAEQEITWPLAEPFYTGPGAVPIEEVGLPCAVNGRGFLIDFSDQPGYLYRFRQTTVNLLNTQQAASGGDQSQVPPEVWRRSLESWNGGAGQSEYDRADSAPTRFRSSSNVDVWTPWQLSLLHDTAQVLALPPGTSFLERVGPDQTVAAVGQNMWWWGLDLTAVPVGSSNPTPILDVTTDGQTLYVLGSDGHVTAWTDSGTSSVFATGVPVVSGRMLLRYLKGYLVAASGSSLYDVSTGTPALIYTHPLDGYTWVDACEGNGAAFLLAGQGDRWQIHAMTPLDDATTFNPPVPAGPVPDGEVGNAIGSYLGYVFVGLSTGWRFGVPDTQNQVTLGRLIATDNPVHCFEGQDRFVWYGRSADPSTPPAGLGRADLSSFTSQLTLAYASDLETQVTTGVVRRVRSIGMSSGGLGRRAFTIDGVGVYLETETLAPSGWVRTGVLSFNTSDAKQGLYCQLYTQPLHGSVGVDAYYDRGSVPITLTTSTTSGAVSAGKIPVSTVAFNTFEPRFTLTRDSADHLLGPVVTRFELRCLPVAGRATELRIPLVIGQELDNQGAAQLRDPQADVDWLMALALTKEAFVLRVGARRYRTYMVDFAWLPEKLDEQARALAGMFVVVAREMS